MQKNRWTIVLLTFLFVSLFFPVAYAENSGMELSPPMKDIAVDPGVEKTFEILLGNNSESKDLNVKVLLMPISQEQEGNYNLVAENGPFSAVPWMELKTDHINLPPRSQGTVTVKVKAPRGSSGSRAAAIVFQVIPDDKDKEAENIGGSTVFYHRLTTIVKVTVNSRSNRKEASIANLYVADAESDKRFLPYGKNALAVVCTLANEGNVLLNTAGRIIIRNQIGRRVKEAPLGAGRCVILPGSKVDLVSLFVDGLPDGEYGLEVTIPFGGSRPLQAKTKFTVRKKAIQDKKSDIVKTIRLFVTPEEVKTNLPSGSFRSIPVILMNSEKYPVKIHGAFKPVEVGLDGELAPAEEEITQYTAIPWLALEQKEIVLAPGERKNIRVSISIPKGTGDGTRYASLVFEATRADSKDDPTVTSISTPIVIDTGKKLERKAAVSGMQVFQDPKTKGWVFGGTLQNQGNTHFMVTGKLVLRKMAENPNTKDGLEVLNAQWEDIETIPIVDSPGWLLPGVKRPVFALCTKQLEYGNYQAEFFLDIGEQSPVRAKCIFRLAKK